MSVAVAITRTDLSATELRMSAAATRDACVARRLLALALVLEGSNRTEAARLCGMDRQTLRDWVHRYNDEGLDGLCNRPLPGRPARLTQAQQGLVAGWIEAGADLGRDGVIRWRRIDVKRRIETEFGKTMSEQAVGKLLHRLGFSHISVRPRHPKHDACAQQTHKKTSAPWLPPPFRRPRVTGRSKSGGRTKPASANKAA
jgi:transposase